MSESNDDFIVAPATFSRFKVGRRYVCRDLSNAWWQFTVVDRIDADDTTITLISDRDPTPRAFTVLVAFGSESIHPFCGSSVSYRLSADQPQRPR